MESFKHSGKFIMIQSSLNREKKKWQTGQKISREVSNSVENDLVQNNWFQERGICMWDCSIYQEILSYCCLFLEPHLSQITIPIELGYLFCQWHDWFKSLLWQITIPMETRFSSVKREKFRNEHWLDNIWILQKLPIKVIVLLDTL